jgi:hypothetical protein
MAERLGRDSAKLPFGGGGTFRETDLSGPIRLAMLRAGPRIVSEPDKPGVNYISVSTTQTEPVIPFVCTLGGTGSTHAHYMKAARFTIQTHAPLTIVTTSWPVECRILS